MSPKFWARTFRNMIFRTRPSFWVRRTRFAQEYAKFGEFWFPVHTRHEAELRLFGRAIMEIDYFGYEWQPRTGTPRPTSSLAVKTSPPKILPLPEFAP